MLALLATVLLHPGGIPSGLAKVSAKGEVNVRLRFDVLTYTLDQTPEELSEASVLGLIQGPTTDLDTRLKEAETRFKKQFQITGSKGKAALTVTFPKAAAVHQAYKAHPHLPLLLPVTIRAQLPKGSTSVSFRFPEILPTVILTVERDGFAPYSEPVRGGVDSKTLTLR